MMEDFAALKKINWKESQFYDLKKLFNCCKQFLNQPMTQENYNGLFNNFLQLFSYAPLPLIEILEPEIARARPNLNGEIFSHETDISYNSKFPDRIRLGRFNLPHESVFYGSLQTDDRHSNHHAACMIEACKELVDDKNQDQYFEFTVASFSVKPFLAICLCFNDEHLRYNERMQRSINVFKLNISNECKMEHSTFIHQYQNYLSSLSALNCKDESAYMIMIAFFHAIREIYQKENIEVSGIVYPSAITDCKGLNIVLTRKAADAYLTFTNARMYKVERSPGKELNACQMSDVAQVIGGAFSFKNIDRTRFT